jgi:hypothetical protein
MSNRQRAGKIKLSVNQRITILFSLLALLLSIITVYYSFFYASSKLVGTVSSVTFDNKGKFTIAFSLNNPGNQIITIPDAAIMVVYLDGSFKLINNQTFSPYFPIVLNEGDSQLISASGDFSPGDFYPSADRSSENCQQNQRTITIGIDIISIDWKGNKIVSRMPMSAVCMDQNQVVSLTEDSDPKNLLSNKYKIPIFLKPLMMTP